MLFDAIEIEKQVKLSQDDKPTEIYGKFQNKTVSQKKAKPDKVHKSQKKEKYVNEKRERLLKEES